MKYHLLGKTDLDVSILELGSTSTARVKGSSNQVPHPFQIPY